MTRAKGAQRASAETAFSKIDELAVLARINGAVIAQRDRRSLVQSLQQVVEGVLPADVIVLAACSESGETRVWGAPESGAASLQWAPFGSLFLRAANDRGSLVLSSLEPLRADCPEFCEALESTGVRSLAVLALNVGGKLLGALSLLSFRPNAWQGVLPEFMEAVGATVAAALDNCLAHEHARSLGDELKALLDVNVAAGRHLERDELFGAVAACLRNLIETDRFGIELPIEGNRLQGHLLTPTGAGSEPTRVKVLPAKGTACHWVLENRQWLVTGTVEDVRERFPATYEVMTTEGMESLCAMPLVSADRARGVLFFMAARPHAYGGLRRGLFDQVATTVAMALDDCLAHEELRRLRDRLAAENVYLQEEIQSQYNFDEIVGNSPALAAILAEVHRVAPTDTTVLITGETGTGKELVARAIHSRSRRRDKPLIKVNCAALPAGLIESELFGHEKGAFSGAISRRIGRFELANGGTIFLDEVGELPPEAQAKLLRVLQEREFERVGGGAPIKVDVRVIAATNRDLAQLKREQRFREDLYYRLNVFPVRLPPLRERGDDVAILAQHLLARFSARTGKAIEGVAPDTMARLLAYPWPGNVRELENVIERAAILATGPILEIGPEILSMRTPGAEVEGRLDEAQRKHILDALERSNWVIEGARGAAAVLGLHPNTLRSRMKKLGLARPVSS